ncbi:MAG: ADP-ribosylglycohydrolase family protein [Acidobacteriaceae bacterium]|nr:ADP-ribosylglycohydrolase family protein [Acidobacteriaceae bacterium]
MTFRQRVIACFKGLAIGDAIGKQTETLSRADVQKYYPTAIKGFFGKPGEIIPRYAGKRYEWRFGETTDDTEQTIAVARALLQEGEAKHEVIGKELLNCKKSVHPEVSIWEFQKLGDPGRVAYEGNGCGAAMRTAPIGVIYPPGRLDELVQAAYEGAVPTHGGQLAIGAAAAVACAVSTALDGSPISQVLATVLQASRKAERFRSAKGTSSIATCIETIHSDLAGKTLEADEIARKWFPHTPETIAPLAISLALITESAEQTTLLAANIGGDSDSVASIGSAIAGALRPETVNEEWYQVVASTNDYDLISLAASLADLQPRT